MVFRAIVFHFFLTLILVLLAPHKGSVIQDNPLNIENEEYLFRFSKTTARQGDWIMERKRVKILFRSLSQEFMTLYSKDDPSYGFGKRAEGGSPVAVWGAEQDMEIWDSNQFIIINPEKFEVEGNMVTFYYEENNRLTFESTVTLPEEHGVPEINWTLQPKEKGYFAVVFTGLEEIDPSRLDFLYQPLIWSRKRFPGKAVLTPESYATTPSVFTDYNGATKGLTIPSHEIPYRFATAENSRFGLILRTNNGFAKPMVMAPIYGGMGSLMEPGKRHQFSIQYFMEPGTWKEDTDYIYQHVMDYPLERQNAMVSLNETFHNMIDWAMDDFYSGWIQEYKGYDYKFDVPNTVKNVSALHPISIALITDNDFSTNAGLRDSHATFVNDYSSTWQELLELYELTKEEKYLDVAYEGAKQLALWTRSTPLALDQPITVNEGGEVDGVFPGRRFRPDSYEWQEFDLTTHIQEQVVPAWHTSFVGLLPEQPGTYQTGSRTPLIISGPNVKAGRTQSLVSSLDLAPTILNLAGIAFPESLQGVSFLEILNNHHAVVREVAFAERNWHRYSMHERMVKMGDYLYIRNNWPNKRNLSGESDPHKYPAAQELWAKLDEGDLTQEQALITQLPQPAEQLFDLKKDPHNLTNVIHKTENMAVLAHMRLLLTKWTNETGDNIPDAPTPNKATLKGEPLKWERGETPGETTKAYKVNHSGPVFID